MTCPGDTSARPRFMLRGLLLALFLLLALAVPTALTANSPDEAKREPLVVFLVRHAEKVDASKDPELSDQGRKRALDLARLLRDSGVEHVHSTDYVRTRTTAAPVAQLLGLDPEPYDPRDLPGLVQRLRDSAGRHLVVGHSNTTPQAVKLLGGEAGPEIDEATEYDRLYVVTVGTDGRVSTVVLRYGG